MKHVLALQSSTKIQHSIQNIMAMLKDTSDAYSETDLHTLNVHLLDHIIENVEILEGLGTLRSS